MAAPAKPTPTMIESKAQLVADLEAACKPRDRWRIGTEHEKFGFTVDDLRPMPYEGPSGIRALLDGLQQFGWQPVLEDGKPIALTMDQCNISLEPGGQFELSGAPLENLHQTCDEVHTHLHQVKTVAADMGIAMIGLGFNPKWTRDDMPWMPKGRYAIMRRYMPTKGNLGLDMMLRTCTIQVNLDFESEADMVEKFRIGLALQSVATALWANSPFTEGKPNGYLSYRSQVWTDTDPDRCGLLDFVFEDGMGFERYVDHVLDVPMYFVHRGGYRDVAGQSFRRYMTDGLPDLPGEAATMGDWNDHLTTLFPEVRLKKYLEMRGADGGAWGRICALPAFWVGLLYDPDAQSAAWDLVKDWSLEELHMLRDTVPRQGLKTPFRRGTVVDLARQALEIATHGLKRRAIPGKDDADESRYLDPLHAIAESGLTPAEINLSRYAERWDGSVDPLFSECAY